MKHLNTLFLKLAFIDVLLYFDDISEAYQLNDK